MKRFGLIGEKLRHSFSKAFFEECFREQKFPELYSYSNYELAQIEDLLPLLSSERLQGFNVTIPYKQAIIPYLSGISSEAAEMNAVNCVLADHGSLCGYNTDLPAFLQSFSALFCRDQRALIIGTGAGSSMVAYALRQVGIPFIKAGRNLSADVRYADLTLDTISGHKLIINTTPLGTFPNCDESPNIPYEGIGSKHKCIDLTYNPPESRFLIKCRERGAETKNGLAMLKAQAILSYQIWNISPHN